MKERKGNLVLRDGGPIKFIGHNDHKWTIYRGVYDGVPVWTVWVSGYLLLETKRYSDIEKITDVFRVSVMLDEENSYRK